MVVCSLKTGNAQPIMFPSYPVSNLLLTHIEDNRTRSWPFSVEKNQALIPFEPQTHFAYFLDQYPTLGFRPT